MPELSLHELSSVRLECPQCGASIALVLRGKVAETLAPWCTVCGQQIDNDSGKIFDTLVDLAHILQRLRQKSDLRLVLESEPHGIALPSIAYDASALTTPN